MKFLMGFHIFSVSAKVALIFGANGQDGAYLSDLLLTKNYKVHAVVRRSSASNLERIEKFVKQNPNHKLNLELHYGDLMDSSLIYRLINDLAPDEIYNFAAQSDVRISFDNPELTCQVNAMGVLRILEAIRQSEKCNKIKFFQASSSEIFGEVDNFPQDEKSCFHPRSPYGVSKLCAHWMVINYRESYGIFACNGILYNHESPLRGDNFVTKKIVKSVVRISRGSREVLLLGNLDSKRDWGYARDYVNAMWLMLQQDKPDDYILATGELHSVREFAQHAFGCMGIDLVWEGSGINEIGKNKNTGDVVVAIDAKLFRPIDNGFLVGSSEKALYKLDWRPQTHFQNIIKFMIDYELQIYE